MQFMNLVYEEKKWYHMTLSCVNEFQHTVHSIIIITILCGTNKITTCYHTYPRRLFLPFCDSALKKKGRRKTYDNNKNSPITHTQTNSKNTIQ